MTQKDTLLPSSSTKTRRKILQAQRKGKGLQHEEKEGVIYKCGEF